MGAFVSSFEVIDDTERSSETRPHPQEYAGWVYQQLANLKIGDPGILRFRRPRPTAAFSPQDTTHPAYESAKALARAEGFEPIERGTGGRLTMFDENALGITILSPHVDPHKDMMLRYEVVANAITRALASLGIEARIGELPNEYCPGRFSIHAAGQFKLVGIAQRMNQRCVQMGAIVSINHSKAACRSIAAAYEIMGLPFDPKTYGAITDVKPDLTYRHVVAACKAELFRSISI